MLKFIGVGAILAALLWGATGCTTDPSKGGFIDGIYGMSSGKYDERKQQKQTEYQKLVQANQALSAEKQELSQQNKQLSAEEQKYKKQIAALETEIQEMKQKLQSTTTTSQAQLAEKKKLESQLEQINIRIDKVDSSQVDTKGLEAELRALAKEKEKLREQILRLGKS